MKEWIKNHPWRLEIVPFALVLCAAVLPLMYLGHLSHPHYYPGKTEAQKWLAVYVVGVGFILLMLIACVRNNHDWVTSEEKKRFNYLAPGSAGSLALFACLTLYSLTPFPYVWLALPVSVIVEAVIEWRRPYVQHLRERQAPAWVEQVHPGDKFYYRESKGTSKWESISWALLMAFFMAIRYQSVWIGALVGVGVLLVFAFSWKGIIITNERVSARLDLFWLRIPMYDVQACHSIETGTLELLGGPNVHILVEQPFSGTVLRVETKLGKEYVFGVEDSATACRLINTALAAREQPPA